MSIKDELAILHQAITDPIIKLQVQRIAEAWEKIKKKDASALLTIEESLVVINHWLKTAELSKNIIDFFIKISNELMGKINNIPSFMLSKEKKAMLREQLNELNSGLVNANNDVSPLEHLFQLQYAPNHQVRKDAIQYCQRLNELLEQLIDLKQLKGMSHSGEKIASITGIKPHDPIKHDFFKQAIQHLAIEEKNKWMNRMLERQKKEDGVKKVSYKVKQFFLNQQKNPLNADALIIDIDKAIAHLSSTIAENAPDFTQQLIKATPEALQTIQDKSYGLVIINETKLHLDSLMPTKGHFFHQLWEALQAFFGFETPRRKLFHLVTECKGALSNLDPTYDKNKIEHLKFTTIRQGQLTSKIQQMEHFKNILTKPETNMSDDEPSAQDSLL